MVIYLESVNDLHMV